MVTEDDLSDVGMVSDVQVALGDTDGTIYDQAVVERNLTRARVVVANYADDSATDGQLREAVIAVAAYGTATASPMTTRKEAANNIKEVDVESYLSSLEADKEDAIDSVSPGKATFRVH